MANTIIDSFSELILAIKDEPVLKQKLIDICKLPTQQRIIEIEKYRVENQQLPLSKVMHLFKNDMIVNEVVKYLTGEYKDSKLQSATGDAAQNFLKKNILVIAVIAILIVIVALLAVIILKLNNPSTAKNENVIKLDSVVLPANYKQSIYLNYRKICDEDNPTLRVGYIEKFLNEYPNSDYTEEVRYLYLKTLFELKDLKKIELYMKINMDYNSEHFFKKIDILIENKYYDQTKQLLTEQLNKNYEENIKNKMRAYLGDILYLQGVYELSIQTYFDLIKNNVLDNEVLTRVFFKLSMIFKAQNNFAQAEKQLKKIVTLSESAQYRVLAYMLLTDLYFQNSKKQLVLDYCRKILNEPDIQVTYILFGQKLNTSHIFAQYIKSRM